MKNPFIEIMTPYFAKLESLVGHLADESTKHNVDPPDLVRDFLGNEKMNEIANTIILPDLSGFCIQFWKTRFSLVEREIDSLPGLRSMFGGDIGPQARQKLYQRVGIYFDTVIVSDPVLRSLVNPQFQRHRDYYVLKFAVNLVLSRQMYLCDSYPPVAVLRGEPHVFGPDEEFYRELSFATEIDTVLVTNRLFGKTFSTLQEANDEFVRAGSDDEILDQLVEPEALILIGEIPPDPVEQLKDVDREIRLHMDDEVIPAHMKGPIRILSNIHLRMMQVNDVLRNSVRTKSHPIIQAPVSFHWLRMKLETNASVMEEAIGAELLTQLPVTNALLSSELSWLCNVQFSDLEQMRGLAFLIELRQVMSCNIDTVSTAHIDDLTRIARQVDINLNTALNKHQSEIQKSLDQRKDDILALTPALLATVGGSLLPLIGVFPEWLFPAVTAAGGVVTLKDLIPKLQTFRREKRESLRSPMGILWNARETSLDSANSYSSISV